MIPIREHLVFCLPGDSFSGRFLENWTDIILSSAREGYRLSFSRRYTPVVITTRNNILGGFWKDGHDQKPFKGNLDYDYQVWIDSDQVVTWKQIKQLISWRKDIVAGWTATEGMQFTAMTEVADEDFREKTGHWPKVSISEMESRKELFKCYAVGFGLVVIKKGVCEKIGYPWFEPLHRMERNGMATYLADDESFCFKAREKGFDVWVDPNTRIGHKKSLII